MLDGWYCSPVAEVTPSALYAVAEDEEEVLEESKYKKEYKILKTKLRSLIYENESFHDSLRLAQKHLLVATRDRTFLLDRLLEIEKLGSTTESEDTDSSEDDSLKFEQLKRIKIEPLLHTQSNNSNRTEKKKSRQRSSYKQQFRNSFMSVASTSGIYDGHMTPKEVERHLQSRQTYLELIPERIPLTVPTEMFSNESLYSESNDVTESFASNVEDDLIVDVINE